MMRRLAFLGTFAMVLFPFVFIVTGTLIVAGVYWLLTGKNAESILVNRPLVWLTEAPFEAGKMKTPCEVPSTAALPKRRED